MTKEDLLKENGWTIECESLFEIRHENGSFASMDGAYAVASELQLNSIISSILLFTAAMFYICCYN